MDTETNTLAEHWRHAVLNALQTCKILVPIFTPRYFKQEACGREVEFFLWRMRENGPSLFAPRSPRYIFPLMWVPTDWSRIPKPLSHIQIYEDGFPVAYRDYGLRKLALLSRYKDQYKEVLFSLATIMAEATTTSPDLPPLKTVPSFKDLPNAFAAKPESSIDIGTSTQGGLLPAAEPSQVQLSVHYPPKVRPNVWSTLLAYVHIPEALRIVQEQTNLRLGRPIADGYLRTSGIAARDFSRGAEITVILTLPGCFLDRERAKFLWLEDWHCEEFQFKSTAGRPVVGQIAFFAGPILICEIAVFIQLTASGVAVKGTTTTSDPYESIFVSYSHDDSEIVEQLEKAYSVLGLQCLRDIRILRSGEQWNPALLSKIEEADVFQLFWSHAAKRSEYVTKERKHALGLNRECFLRPVY